MQEVREETGYEAEVVDELPGFFNGGTTTNAFFVMRHIGPPRRADWETASVRWVDFDAAEKRIARTTNAIGRARDLAILKAARAWFDANLTVVLPDDEGVPLPARRYDWEVHDLPARHVVLRLDFVLSKAEALGQNLITAFSLAPDYCAGEDPAFLVSEALAALSMAVGAAFQAIGEAVDESENPEDHEEAEEAL